MSDGGDSAPQPSASADVEALRQQLEARAAISSKVADKQLSRAHSSRTGGATTTTWLAHGRGGSGKGMGPASDGDVASLEAEVRALSTRCDAAEAMNVKLKDELERAERAGQTAQGHWDKEVAAHRDTQAQLKVSEAQVALLKKELTAAQRHKAASASDEAKLNRALQDLERTRQQLAEANQKLMDKAAAAPAPGRVSELEQDVRSLQSQRSEFVNVIRKQNRLIDVLKRQKFHLEAAKLLQITEQEFAKVLEGDEDAR
jgi:chromosome segregation ATPase